ncbi:TPA: single-stranded DNA-binding protein, partial [Staphylococcus aureus]
VFTTDIAVNNITFVERKNNGQSNNQQQHNSYNTPQNRQQSNNPFANANGPIEISDDDLPF